MYEFLTAIEDDFFEYVNQILILVIQNKPVHVTQIHLYKQLIIHLFGNF